MSTDKILQTISLTSEEALPDGAESLFSMVQTAVEKNLEGIPEKVHYIQGELVQIGKHVAQLPIIHAKLDSVNASQTQMVEASLTMAKSSTTMADASTVIAGIWKRSEERLDKQELRSDNLVPMITHKAIIKMLYGLGLACLVMLLTITVYVTKSTISGKAFGVEGTISAKEVAEEVLKEIKEDKKP